MVARAAHQAGLRAGRGTRLPPRLELTAHGARAVDEERHRLRALERGEVGGPVPRWEGEGRHREHRFAGDPERLAARGDDPELREPLAKLRERGAEVEVLSVKPGEIRSWDKGDWGDSVAVDRLVGEARPDDYDGLVLPGGQINPDVLRTKPEAVGFVRAFAATGKPLAAICHAPWLLVEAGIAKGREVTSWPSVRTE